MSQVLGKIAPVSDDEARGPDVVHKVRVHKDWLCRGATVELELPRNLHCAQCDGGGCDRCQRSGAITLRDKQEPPELVTVTLPNDRNEDEPGVTLRIPECGGFPEDDARKRGLLLLRVVAGEKSDDTIKLCRDSLTPTAQPYAAVDPQLVKRSGLIAAMLVLLFVLMLYLSGWL